jgi:hypothetical protein
MINNPAQDHQTMTESAPPSDLLTGFILSILTPFLMTGSITDPDLARRAATETIAAYRSSAQDQLVTIAQIVAFALTALDALRLSLPPDLSLSMKLKLRGNANALNRTSQHAAATLEAQQRDITAPDPTEILTALESAKAIVQQAKATKPATPHPERDRQIDLAWANAMTDVAAEYTAELPALSPAERQNQVARIGALSKIATSLSSGDAPPLKARLLGTTSLNTRHA